MVYLLPDLEYPTGNQFDKRETIWLAVSAYTCAFLFTLLLAFALFNSWNYLYKQSKWRVFLLTMFYILSTLCLALRVVVNIFTVWAAQYFIVTLIVFPAVLKFEIGLVQIAIIFEISMRVKENVTSQSILSEKNRKSARTLIN